MSTETKKLMPTGECWCGCGDETPVGAFFAPGHDKRAESAVITLRYGTVAAFIVHHGFGPGGRNPKKELEELRRKGEG